MPEPAEGQDAHTVVATPGEAIAAPPRPLPPPEPETPRPRHVCRVLTFGVVGVALCALGYGQIHSIRALFNSLLPYAPVVFPSLIALGTIIFKDSEATSRIGSVGAHPFQCWQPAVSASRISTAREEKAEAARVNQQNVDGLEGRVTAAQQAQTENTKIFTKQFSELSKELSDLKTKVTTEELQDKIVSLQARWTRRSIRRARNWPFSFAPIKVVKVDATHTYRRTHHRNGLPVAADGSVHVEFTVLNLTNVDAMDGEMILQICDTCTFAKEPARFTKLVGQDDRSATRPSIASIRWSSSTRSPPTSSHRPDRAISPSA